MATSSVTVSSINLKWNEKAIKQYNLNAQKAIFAMGYEIAASARAIAPVVTGALRNSIRVEELQDESGIRVIAGGASSKGSNKIVRFIDYAAKREMGPNRNPATEHYMQKAQQIVMGRDWVKKFFKGVTQ